MVSDVTIGSALNQQQNTAASSATLAEDFAQFLTLLTVQLQNQDPLSPMDSTEFTNQLVAFSGVEQQINSNQKLDSLVALQIGDSFSLSQNYVGKEISYISSEFEFSGAPSKILYSMDGVAEVAKINVYNESGDVIYSEDAIKTPGAHDFVWNGQLTNGGTAVPGTYVVRVAAADSEENPIQSTTVVTGRVRGTEAQNGQVFLLVGERAVPLNAILSTNQESAGGGSSDALTAALSYVGLNISYLNTELDYDGNGVEGENIVYTLDAEADRAKILIYDDAGELIFTSDVDTNEGQSLFHWDGTLTDGSPAPAGTYQFVIDAIDENDNRIPYSSLASGLATGVETRNGEIFLNIGINSINLNNVVSADIPETTGT